MQERIYLYYVIPTRYVIVSLYGSAICLASGSFSPFDFLHFIAAYIIILSTRMLFLLKCCAEALGRSANFAFATPFGFRYSPVDRIRDDPISNVKRHYTGGGRQSITTSGFRLD